MWKKLFLFVFAVSIFVFARSIAQAEDLTLEVVKNKVLAAAKLIEENGESAFPNFKNLNGEFRFADGKGYVWVHSGNGIMLMHPVKPELEGTDMIGEKDSSGFPYILAMNRLTARNGQGWVVYLWPKPGKRFEEIKASFVKQVKKNNKVYVIGCGMYAASTQYVKSMCPGDVIYDSDNFKEQP
jgi:signal transduction histidine kinase